MRRAALSSVLGAAMALAGSSAAFGQAAAPQPTPQPTPAPTPPPAPAPGKLQLVVTSFASLHGRPYVLKGDVVTVAGKVKPFVAGQRIRVRISTPHRKPTVVRTRIAKGGTFQVRFRTRRAVKYTIYARHNPTPEQALFAAKGAVSVVAPGQRMAVSLLKQGLRALGYPAGNGPSVTSKLGRSVLAFRKTNGLARVYTADRHIYDMVFAGRGAYKLRYPKAGK